MTDTLDLGDGQSPILSLLQQAVFEDNLFRKLNAVDILISALEPHMAKISNSKEMQRYIHQDIFGYSIEDESEQDQEKQDFMRKLRLFSKVSDMPETAIEYYGIDFITHPEFHFDNDFDVKLKEINLRLNKFIGILIREYSKGEELEL